MEISRLFSWYKLVACKSPACKDFPFDYFFWMKVGRFFSELHNVMPFPDASGFEWGPWSSKYYLSFVPQFWKLSRMQPSVLPAALQQPKLFCRIALCPFHSSQESVKLRSRERKGWWHADTTRNVWICHVGSASRLKVWLWHLAAFPFQQMAQHPACPHKMKLCTLLFNIFVWADT